MRGKIDGVLQQNRDLEKLVKTAAVLRDATDMTTAQDSYSVFPELQFGMLIRITSRFSNAPFVDFKCSFRLL